jgi:hypothetical protein
MSLAVKNSLSYIHNHAHSANILQWLVDYKSDCVVEITVNRGSKIRCQ